MLNVTVAILRPAADGNRPSVKKVVAQPPPYLGLRKHVMSFEISTCIFRTVRAPLTMLVTEGGLLARARHGITRVWPNGSGRRTPPHRDAQATLSMKVLGRPKVLKRAVQNGSDGDSAPRDTHPTLYTPTYQPEASETALRTRGDA
jgi:hypothetical protein